MLKKPFILLLLVLLTCSSYAQDPQFSQFYSIPLYLNPAFAGNTPQGRLIGNYRNQWPAIPGAFVTYSFSYDHNLSAVNSGIGVQVIRDKAGSGGLRFTNVGGQYAYYLKLSDNLSLRSGLHFSRSILDIDFSSLNFNDQLIRGGGVATSESYIGQRVGYWDFASGIVLFSDKFWVGMSSRHLTKPNQSLTGGESLLPVKYDFHGGINLPAGGSASSKKKQYFTPSFRYKLQEKYDQLDMGLYFTHEPLVIGLWYRGIPVLKSYQPSYANNDAVILLFGYSIKNFRVGYSYDITISRLVTNTGGSHEVSLIYEFITENKKNQRKREKFAVPCAKF